MAKGRERAEQGAAAVEFALVSVLLFALLFGTLQYGLYFWSLHSGAQAAREAARQAAVGGLNCSELSQAVLNNAQGETAGSVAVSRKFYTDQTLATTASAAVGGAVQVTVKFKSVDLGLPFVPFIKDGLIQETSVSRVENVTPDSVTCP
jgi:Flp pilus assembly protein TadG